MRALPAEAFDAAAVLSAKVDTKGRVVVRQSFYSVPVGLARRAVTVRLGAHALEVVADGRVVARHARSLHKGTEDLVLDHYLEILVRKPGALPGSTALAQAGPRDPSPPPTNASGPRPGASWVTARARGP